MIQEFVGIWDKHKDEVEAVFREKHPSNYIDVVRPVVKMIHDHANHWCKPDFEKIHVIDDGHYQGTLVYVIPEEGYQPCSYWYVMVSYGSCSGCDTLQSICDYDYDDKPKENQVKDYMVLALHILQNIKKMGEE